MPGMVAKLYSRPPTQDRIDKLRLLVRLNEPKLLDIAAWPTDLIFDKSRQLVGFLMPALQSHVPFTEFSNPRDRKRNHSTCGWDFLIHITRNLAIAMQTMHDAGIVIGDVNDLNIFVDPKTGRIRFIDVDSFQVQDGNQLFTTGVGVPMYLAPELQCLPLENLKRTPNHDSFALGVLIFQALMMGRHPYVGVGKAGDRELPEIIRDLPFAYGDEARKFGINRPQNTLNLKALNDELAMLFTRTFSRNMRPSPSEWVEPLGRFKASLIRCNANSAHKFSPTSSSCPWCHLEQHGVVMFFDVKTSAIDAVASGSNLNGSIQIKAWLDSLPEIGLKPPVEPESITAAPTEGRVKKPIFPLIIFVLAWVIFIIVSVSLVFSGNISSVFWDLVIGGFLLHKVKPKDQKNIEREKRQLTMQKAESNWSLQLKAWIDEDSINRIRKQRNALTHQLSIVISQESNWRKILSDMESQKRSLQLEDYLDDFDIVTASIQGIVKIPRPVIATLASFGITSASDVATLNHMKVPGVGPVRKSGLEAWRKNLSRRFVFNPNLALPAEVVRNAHAKHKHKVNHAEQQVRSLRSSLQLALVQFEKQRQMREPLLRLAANELAVARANLANV